MSLRDLVEMRRRLETKMNRVESAWYRKHKLAELTKPAKRAKS